MCVHFLSHRKFVIPTEGRNLSVYMLLILQDLKDFSPLARNDIKSVY